MPKMYDAIVVGAGPNGLTTAAYLAKAGAKVLIIERRHETGGGLVTEEFSGFRFNLHAIYMMMMDVMPPNIDLDLESFGCTYVRPEVQFSVLTRDGKALTLYADPERSAESIAKFSRRDAELFREVWHDWSEVVENVLVPATYVPPAPALDHVHVYRKTAVGKRMLELSMKSPKDIVKSIGFENNLVNAAFMHLASMWGLDPDMTGVGFMVPLYVVRMLKSSLIKGGSHRLSSAIHKAATAHGADILEAKEVSQIIVENGKAKGVVTSDGDRFEARAVITSTDPKSTFLRLVGVDASRKASESLVRTARDWTWESWSIFGAHLALSERPVYTAAEFDPDVDRALIQLMGSESAEEVLAHIAEIKQGKLVIAGHATTPTDFDPIQAPVDIYPGTAVGRFETSAPYSLAEGSWDDRADAYGDSLIEFWKHYAPNLAKTKIIRKYMFPPTYIEDKLVNMVKGSIKHGAYIPLQMGYFRPNDECSSKKTPIDGLFLCGASSYPGGMILLGSGYGAANVVADYLELPKWWKEPAIVTEAKARGLL